MGAQRGHPTDLTLLQARRILAWFARREAFDRRHGSVGDLAARLKTPLSTVYYYLAAARGNPTSVREGSRGRPRSLSPAKVRRIVNWYQKRQRFLSSLGNAKDLARDLGIREARIFDYIRRANRKPAPPDHGLRKSNAKSERERQTEAISALLRAWPRVGQQRRTSRLSHAKRRALSSSSNIGGKSA